MKRTD